MDKRAPKKSSAYTQHSAREVRVSCTNGIHVRLTFEGIRGWRLQAGATEESVLSALGAAQSLASFLGEADVSAPEEIRVSEDATKIRALAADGSSVVISRGKGLSLRAISAKGETRIEICDLFTADGKFVIEGMLEGDEAVFGGGERFDTVNKRGTEFELYSCDGWNNTSTTYVPIPVFFTSRGGVYRTDHQYSDAR